MQFDNYKTIILDFVASDKRLTYDIAIDADKLLLIHINCVKANNTVAIRLRESGYFGKTVAFFGYDLEVEEKLTEENFNLIFTTMKSCLNKGKSLWALDDNKRGMVGTMWNEDKYYTPQDLITFFIELRKEGFANNADRPVKYLLFSDFYGDNEILLNKDGDTFVVEPCNK
jgi:hypothetical protein